MGIEKGQIWRDRDKRRGRPATSVPFAYRGWVDPVTWRAGRSVAPATTSSTIFERVGLARAATMTAWSLSRRGKVPQAKRWNWL